MPSKAECTEKVFQNLIESLKSSHWQCYADTNQSSPQVVINNDPKWVEEKFLTPYSSDRTQIKRSVDGWLEKPKGHPVQLRLPYDVKLYSVGGVGLTDLHIEQYRRAHSNVLFFIYEKTMFPYPEKKCKKGDCCTCLKKFYPYYIISLSEVLSAPKAPNILSLGESVVEYGPGRLFVEEGRSRGSINIYRQIKTEKPNEFIYEAMTQSSWLQQGNLLQIIDEFANKCIWQKV